MTIFHVDLDKLRNYLWYCYEKHSWWGCRWCKHTPKNLICWNSVQHSWTSAQKWRPTLLDFKKWRPRFAEKLMKTFLEVTPKKVLTIFVGENL